MQNDIELQREDGSHSCLMKNLHPSISLKIISSNWRSWKRRIEGQEIRMKLKSRIDPHKEQIETVEVTLDVVVGLTTPKTLNLHGQIGQ